MAAIENYMNTLTKDEIAKLRHRAKSDAHFLLMEVVKTDLFHELFPDIAEREAMLVNHLCVVCR